jgi:hypothetical protein
MCRPLGHTLGVHAVGGYQSSSASVSDPSASGCSSGSGRERDHVRERAADQPDHEHSHSDGGRQSREVRHRRHPERLSSKMRAAERRLRLSPGGCWLRQGGGRTLTHRPGAPSGTETVESLSRLSSEFLIPLITAECPGRNMKVIHIPTGASVPERGSLVRGHGHAGVVLGEGILPGPHRVGHVSHPHLADLDARPVGLRPDGGHRVPARVESALE